MFKTPLRALAGIMLIAFGVTQAAIPWSALEWRGGLPVLSATGIAQAQTDPSDPGDPRAEDPDVSAPNTPPNNGGSGPQGSAGISGLAGSSTVVNGIIQVLRSGERECGQLPLEYRADCLQHTFRRAADVAEKGRAYSAAAAHLRSAATRISSLVARNVDPAAGRISRGTRSYRAVKKSAVRAVNAAAAAVITETETKLLRSVGSSQQRKIHYQRIAQAVGSTKRILRS